MRKRKKKKNRTKINQNGRSLYDVMCFKINGRSGQNHMKKIWLSVVLKIYQEQHKK